MRTPLPPNNLVNPQATIFLSLLSNYFFTDTTEKFFHHRGTEYTEKSFFVVICTAGAAK
jgi:hypothetical protein